jgi:dCMP deaminase
MNHSYGIECAKDAASFSTCLSSHYGSAIINPVTKYLISSGRNGAPRGMDHCSDRGFCIKRELGYDHFVEDMREWAGMSYCICSHDLQNALIQAGERAYNCIAYLWGERNGEPIIPIPCFTCTKLAINAGISLFVMKQNDTFIELNPVDVYKNYENVLLNKLNEKSNNKL